VKRTVLITGGTGALGEAVTRRFLEKGHRVAVTWLKEDEAHSLRDHLGDLRAGLTLVGADVTAPDSVSAALGQIEAELGPVEVLAHLVGGYRGGEMVHNHSVQTWDSMMEINLRSAFICCRATLPAMRAGGWGRIVMVSSRAARSDRLDQAAYAVAKSGVAVLAEAIAEENRGMDVTANVVAPSILDTPANRAAMPGQDHSAWVPPDEVAATIAFLASEAAGQLRGAWLPLFGSA
jgi:NAD(P)-dependent dehydrogenase (short-subunit alcohol dehydrogenase family)